MLADTPYLRPMRALPESTVTLVATTDRRRADIFVKRDGEMTPAGVVEEEAGHKANYGGWKGLAEHGARNAAEEMARKALRSCRRAVLRDAQDRSGDMGGDRGSPGPGRGACRAPPPVPPGADDRNFCDRPGDGHRPSREGSRGDSRRGGTEPKFQAVADQLVLARKPGRSWPGVSTRSSQPPIWPRSISSPSQVPSPSPASCARRVGGSAAGHQELPGLRHRDPSPPRHRRRGDRAGHRIGRTARQSARWLGC